MLMIAAHVLGGIDRWWSRHGASLPDRGDGTRAFTALNAWLPISVLVIERGEDPIIGDVRILPRN